MTVRRGPAFRPITEDDQTRPEVTGFNCGEQPWQTEIADFLRSGEALKQHRPDRKLTLLYCEDGGEGTIIGYASIIKKRADLGDESVSYLHITYLGVASQYQSLGHGTAMLEILKAFARDGGASFVDLYVHEHNSGAIRLYQKNGFAFLDVEPHVDSNGRYLRMAHSLT